MKAPDCGKICHSQTKATALVLGSQCYRRAYYCEACRAWHTTSQAVHAAPHPTDYRLSTPHYQK